MSDSSERFQVTYKADRLGFDVVDSHEPVTHYLSNGVLSTSDRESADRVAEMLNTAASPGHFSPAALRKLEQVTAETREELAKRDSAYSPPAGFVAIGR